MCFPPKLITEPVNKEVIVFYKIPSIPQHIGNQGKGRGTNHYWWKTTKPSRRVVSLKDPAQVKKKPLIFFLSKKANRKVIRKRKTSFKSRQLRWTIFDGTLQYRNFETITLLIFQKQNINFRSWRLTPEENVFSRVVWRLSLQWRPDLLRRQ